MEKISRRGSNNFCPQALYLYGTCKEDGSANYGLFCWCTYCHTDRFQFVACIGEDKLTRDRIRETGVFSATIVTEKLLPAADYCGTHSGREVIKERVIPSEKGAVLDVPVPVDGMWTFELKVRQTLHIDEAPESDIYICDIVNVRAAAVLEDEKLSLEEKLAMVKPVMTTAQNFFSVGTTSLGSWGQPGSTL
ncbi:MAG: flavin reductase [Ruminococcaceae bacterium]|nr:flavin reductase [Oscillospiraceae bacterium]